MPKRTPTKNGVPGSRSGQGWCMPRTIRNFGVELLAQQLWCWGQDIECPDGNLLMQFGFERLRCPGDAEQSTCYRLDSKDIHVCMWGFGMFFGQRDLGGLYLSRVGFTPRWAPIESLSLEIHEPLDLPFFLRPRGRSQWSRARELWKSLQQWIADYERWVSRCVGLAYRRGCVDSWLRPFVRADRMASAWQFLGGRRWEQSDQSLSQTLRRYTLASMAQ